MALRRQTIDAPVEYEGCVLATREENYHDDSDFYAVVYDRETDSLRRIDYGSTRYAGNSSAQVDATEDVLVLAEAALARLLFRLMSLDDLRRAEAVEQDAPVEVERTIRRRKGRHIQAGERGRVLRLARGFGEPYAEKYGRKPPMRALVEFGPDDVAWLDADDLFVPWDEVGERLTPVDELLERSVQHAQARGFHAPFVRLGLSL